MMFRDKVLFETFKGIELYFQKEFDFEGDVQIVCNGKKDDYSRQDIFQLTIIDGEIYLEDATEQLHHLVEIMEYVSIDYDSIIKAIVEAKEFYDAEVAGKVTTNKAYMRYYDEMNALFTPKELKSKEEDEGEG